MLSKASAMPRASIEGVPLKSMCSMRCVIPATSAFSSRLPARIQTPKDTLVAPSRGSEKTLKPPGSSFTLTFLSPINVLLLHLLQRDAVLLIYLEHTHLDPVALRDDVLDPLDALAARRQARDVHQPVAPRNELDEGAEVRGLHHLAGVDLPGLDFLGHPGYRGSGVLGGDAIYGRDVDRPVILDGDVHPELLLHGIDGLPARTDEEPDLLSGYGEYLDPGRVVRDLRPRRRDGVAHDVQDLQPPLPGLRQG